MLVCGVSFAVILSISLFLTTSNCHNVFDAIPEDSTRVLKVMLIIGERNYPHLRK